MTVVPREITVNVERVETLTGIWCDRCAVSSIITATVALHWPGGRTSIASKTWCTNHNHEEK